MNFEQMTKLLNDGEGFTIEYKKDTNEIGSNTYETVCSFSNRYGGYILLGVKDDGTVLGVNRNAAPGMKKNFINVLNNPEMISPTMYLTLEEFEYEGKLILYVNVPIGSLVECCKSRVFDRNGEADVDISSSTMLVAEMYARKSAMFTERKVFPYATKEHLRLEELLPRVRQMAANNRDKHPWKNLSDDELIRSAGLYEEDVATGEKGYNLACILLFGRDEVIQSCAPGYITDALLRKENLDRYDDRLMVRTNLIDSYDLLMEFIAKHTLDRFFLIDEQRVSVRDKIARELVSNSLTHREFSSTMPAKIVIEQDRIYAENWNRSNTHGKIDPNNFKAYPKNPILARFFVNIGRADTLGSGVRNLYEFTKIYSGGEPELIEGDVFQTIIPTKPLGRVTEDGVIVDVDENVGKDGRVNGKDVSVNNTAKSILSIVSENPNITVAEIATMLGKGNRTIYREISNLKGQYVLRRVGSDKTGYWEVIGRD